MKNMSRDVDIIQEYKTRVLGDFMHVKATVSATSVFFIGQSSCFSAPTLCFDCHVTGSQLLKYYALSVNHLVR
jgi:hypothetical protein